MNVWIISTILNHVYLKQNNKKRVDTTTVTVVCNRCADCGKAVMAKTVRAKQPDNYLQDMILDYVKILLL